MCACPNFSHATSDGKHHTSANCRALRTVHTAFFVSLGMRGLTPEQENRSTSCHCFLFPECAFLGKVPPGARPLPEDFRRSRDLADIWRSGADRARWLSWRSRPKLETA